LKIAGIPVTTFFFIAQIIATCSLGIQSANVTLMIQLKSKKFFVENSLISVVTTLITIGISEKFRLNYTNIFVVWVLGTFLVSFHGAFRIGRSFREKDLAKSAISLSKIKSYWKGSLKSWIVYINPFDSLRLDYFFILHFLGFEALGIYSVISSMLLVMPIMERIAVVRYGPYTNSRHGHNINHVIKKTTSELFILIVIPGILLLIFLHQTVSFVFGHQYNITLSEFLVLWIANAFYWNKRLIVDLVRSHQIDATLGVIELTTIIVTLIGLFAFHPRSIFSFAMVFLVSNTMSFTLTFTYVLKVFKKLPV